MGKTSIIKTIVTDTFPKEVPKVFPAPVTISPDLYLLPNHNNTVLVDSSASKQHEEETDSEIRKSHVVVLVYDVNNFDIIKRLKTYWLPRINRVNNKVPVIICGNKIDLRSSQQDELESLLQSSFVDYSQVEMGIECSAKGYIGLIDMISCAQKSVLFPIAPLHDSLTKKLKVEFERALLRIFRILDKDGDGYLSDEELKNFQLLVFKTDLNKEHIKAFKDVLVAECDDLDDEEA